MADIVLKTYRGSSVTPQDDAIIHQTVIATNGVFKGCQVTYSRGNVLHLSQGFGMIKGRFFEVYDTEIPVQLNSTSETLQGRVYIHLDLSNADEPIQILTETAPVLGTLDGDEDINYNNTTYDMELATFSVTNTALLDLVQTVSKITGASAGGGASSLQRNAEYSVGDFATCGGTPGWVTLYCTKAGVTAAAEPAVYGSIAKVGDVVVDSTCTFVARDIIKEMDALSDDLAEARTDIVVLEEALLDQVDRLPPPVGTIQFSASADVGEEWLKCDGRFISEVDYPELVAELGKLVPDEAVFVEFASDNGVGRRSSNIVVLNGSFWVFSQAASTLYKIEISTGTTTAIPVSFDLGDLGTAFHSQDGWPVYLSIVDDAIFLTQLNNTLANPYVRVFKGNFSESMAALTMTFQPIPSFMNGNQSGTYVYVSLNDIDPNFVPYVGKYANNTTSGYAMMVGKYDNNNYFSATYVIWNDDGWITYTSNQTGYIKENISGYTTLSYLEAGMSICGFNWKNNGLAITLSVTSSSSSSRLGVMLYGFPGGALTESLTLPMTVAQWGECLPLQAGNGVLYKMAVQDDQTVGVVYIKTSGGGTLSSYLTTITIPSRAAIFPDSLTYVAAHAMWVCFVGTGFLFSRNPEDQNSWGYLDTTDKLGVITQMAGAYYNDEDLSIYFYGMTSANVYKFAKLYVGDWFQYANDGAWLPMLSSDGIPAYIKAYEPETTA